MNISLQIKTLLSEAELYRSQGLFSDAKEKYEAAATSIHGLDRLRNKESLLKTISGKIKSLDKTTEKVSMGPSSPELSEKGQDLIKTLFGKNDLEKAVALIKFGQVERALDDLDSLLKVDEYRVQAGKYILQCKILVASTDDAIDQYKQWYAEDLFAADQLKAVREYLQLILKKEGVAATLPMPVLEEKEGRPFPGAGHFDSAAAEPEEEILDITSIGIPFASGPNKGRMVEFDVNFQSGDMLSLIISKADEGLISDFNNGDQLTDVQFYSPIAMFKGTAVVANKTQINTGPKQGDYCLDLKVTST